MVGFADDWDPNAAWTPNTPITYTGDPSNDSLTNGLIDSLPVNSPSEPVQSVDSALNPSTFQADMQARQSQNILQPEPNKPLEEKSFFSNLGDSFSATMKKHGGEIFASTMVGSAQGVLAYLLQRRQERAARDLENTKNQNRVAETNASVARASAMPKLGSIVKPGVTGQQRTGSGGLISAVQQRGV